MSDPRDTHPLDVRSACSSNDPTRTWPCPDNGTESARSTTEAPPTAPRTPPPSGRGRDPSTVVMRNTTLRSSETRRYVVLDILGALAGRFPGPLIVRRAYRQHSALVDKPLGSARPERGRVRTHFAAEMGAHECVDDEPARMDSWVALEVLAHHAHRNVPSRRASILNRGDTIRRPIGQYITAQRCTEERS